MIHGCGILKIRFSWSLYFSRVGIVEESAIRELKERLYANKTALMEAFLERDKENTGTNSMYCFWASTVLSSSLVDFWMTLICFMSSFFTKHQNSSKLATFILCHVKVLLKGFIWMSHHWISSTDSKVRTTYKQIVPIHAKYCWKGFIWMVTSEDFIHRL